MKTIFTTIAFEEVIKKGKVVPQGHPSWMCRPPAKIDCHYYGWVCWDEACKEYRFEPQDDLTLPVKTLGEIQEFMKRL